MILVDANLLIYASVPTMPAHSEARAWLEDELSSSVKVALPWMSLLAYLRISSDRRLFPSASLEDSWQTVHQLLTFANTWIPQPTEAHPAILERLSRGIPSKMMNDAHLAALALEHGLVLCSTDGDFARFEGLRWENPLKVGAE